MRRFESLERALVAAISVTLLWCSASQAQQNTVTAEGPLFTLDQARTGAQVYQTHCAACHGVTLGGGEAAPALTGRSFSDQWRSRTLGDLLSVTMQTMPTSNPGGLSLQAYEGVVAFLLNRNGYRASNKGLASTTQASHKRLLDQLGMAAPERLPPLMMQTDPLVEWLHHRGTPHSTNYSPLDMIDQGNAADLTVAWRWRSDNFGPVPWSNYQVTPLMANGVLYATAGARRGVVAIDAETGETLWMYRLNEGQRGETAPRKGPGRGVAYHREGLRETVYVITPGYQLVALDASTGRPRQAFGHEGVVDLKNHVGGVTDTDTAAIGASSPPIVVNGVVVVGAAFSFSGAPKSPQALAGNITAYDAASGALRWRFNTIPQPNEEGHDTWLEDSASYTGNTGVWAPMTADPELGYIYLPVEAPTSDYYGGHRPGDNLFGQSLVCLNAATGERVWHFQTVHHPIWDYDLPAPPGLMDLHVDGRDIPAVAQITKQGLTFVFDRRTGEPGWPIAEQPVLTSQVPGERTAKTQPIPSLPEPFGRNGTSKEQLNDLTPEVRAEAERIAAGYLMGPLYTPPTLVTEESEGTLMLPGSVGGANWQGAVADPETATLYVSYAISPEVAGLISDPDQSSMRYVLKNATVDGPFDLPLLKPPWGWITALDMQTGRILWQRPNSDTPEEIQRHPKLKGATFPATGNDDRSGLLVTKTLLFSGEGAGMYGSRWGGSLFRAHDKATGEVLAAIDLGQRQTGVPMTYAMNGRQYIVVATGAPGEAGQLVALTLK